MPIKVNTYQIKNSAQKINSYNRNIRNKFASVEGALNALDRSWESGVSNSVMSSFRNIKRDFPENRFKVIDDMTKFMINIASDGYEKTEESVESVASAFK